MPPKCTYLADSVIISGVCDDEVSTEWLRERTELLDIFLFFPPVTHWCFISDVLFTGGMEVSDFSILKYY